MRGVRGGVQGGVRSGVRGGERSGVWGGEGEGRAGCGLFVGSPLTKRTVPTSELKWGGGGGGGRALRSGEEGALSVTVPGAVRGLPFSPGQLAPSQAAAGK